MSISADDDRCAVAQEVLARLGDKWSVHVIRTIAGEPIRFTDLQRKVSARRPIAARVLARTLKQLERDGLIARKQFPVVPPRVEYRLTGLGRRFFALTDRVVEWTMAHDALLRSSSGHAIPQSSPLAN
ncbi:MAG: winged helix-turn-helix transcriptional regulator [Parvibaculaceae bacterium]